MTFVTRLVFTSGDRDVLERIVGDIKHIAERKGVALKGPHSHPPTRISVPQQQRLLPDDSGVFAPWEYRVYSRELEIHGYESFARDVADRTYPRSVHVEMTIGQIRGMGRD